MVSSGSFGGGDVGHGVVVLELPAAGHIVQGAVSLGVSDKGVYERGGVRNGGGGTDADGDAASDSHDAVRVEHDLVVLALDGALERGAVHGKGSGPAGADGEQAVRRAVNIDVLRVPGIRAWRLSP